MQSRCGTPTLCAQESEKQSKESLHRMEAVNLGLTEKVEQLEKRCLDLRQMLAEVKGAAGVRLCRGRVRRCSRMDEGHVMHWSDATAPRSLWSRL